MILRSKLGGHSFIVPTNKRNRPNDEIIEMNIPGFSAETSLYKTSRHYRSIVKFGQADGTIYPALPINDLVKSSIDSIDLVIKSSRDFSDFIYVDRPFPTAIPCGALGKACCRAPLQNVPGFGPLVSCQQGLGCDITTNKCVSPCGGTGQVCCDGPETRAPKWTADGKIYSPNNWNMREMCDAGVCNKQTHRCITCGTRDGGPCCSSDAAQATARCFRDAKTGNRLVCNDRWVGDAGGVCLECGKSGQPKCLTAGEAPCDDGLVERETDGICVPCGWAGLPTCDRGEPCRDGRSVPDRWFQKCVPAGGPNQPCRPDGGCDYQGLFCNNSRICQSCGRPGEVCCAPGNLDRSISDNTGCLQPAVCLNNSCFACGQKDLPVCPGKDYCRDGSEVRNGWCRSAAPSPPPPPPPPPPQWKTCNGEAWVWSTMKRSVFIKHAANQCIDEFTYNSNSEQEAYTCARRQWGNDAVVTEPIGPFKFALTSQFGCHTVTVNSTDESAAQTCAQWQCINCFVTPGDCP